MPRASSEKLKRLLFDIFDIIAFLVFVIGLVLFIRFFIFNPYTVVGMSMHPTIEPGNFLLINKLSNRKTFERGDIVVFVPVGKEPFIKRIIGLPGETVKIENNSVHICTQQNEEQICEKLDEPYLKKGVKTEVSCPSEYDNSYEITEGYFVLGDNREHSTDSRCCFTDGCYKDGGYTVTQEGIIGKLMLRVYPFNNITIF